MSTLQVIRERNQLKAIVEKLESERNTALKEVGVWSAKYGTALAEAERLREGLEKIANLDFVISLPDRMTAVREIAREYLKENPK